MDCRLVKPVPFSREARLHAEIPTTPVNVRVKDIKACYSQVNEKLVLGQRHSPFDPKKSRKRGNSKKTDHKRGGEVKAQENLVLISERQTEVRGSRRIWGAQSLCYRLAVLSTSSRA